MIPTFFPSISVSQARKGCGVFAGAPKFNQLDYGMRHTCANKIALVRRVGARAGVFQATTGLTGGAGTGTARGPQAPCR